MSDPIVFNDADTLRELSQLYPMYERALMENDAETLTRMFWASPQAMRFGATENLYGIEEIEAFRRERPAAGLARKITRLDIVAFGRYCGSITLEFERERAGNVIRGRQSQVWIRMPEGWRIVAAHVSLLAEP